MTVRIPNAPLKGAFCLHFLFIVWASQFASNLPAAYVAYNGLLLLTILWTLHSRDSEEGPFMGLCINALSVLLDIVTLILCNHDLHSVFSTVCIVANMLLRPVSSFLLYRILRDRAATYGNFTLPAGLENLFPSVGGTGRSPYEDIDQPGATHTLGPETPATDMPSPSHPGLQPYQAKPQDPLGFGGAP